MHISEIEDLLDGGYRVVGGGSEVVFYGHLSEEEVVEVLGGCVDLEPTYAYVSWTTNGGTGEPLPVFEYYGEMESGSGWCVGEDYYPVTRAWV